MTKKISLLLSLFLMAMYLKSFSQATCQGTLGAPLVNITFGNGPNPGPTLPTAVPGASTNYAYNPVTGTPPAVIFDGQYCLVNQIPVNNAWFTGQPDHTGNPNGYMAFFNAAPNAGEFYRQTVNGLCAGTTYEFAAWIVNAVNRNVLPNAATPNVTFNIYDVNNQTVPLVTFATGAIASTTIYNWQRYSTLFTTPAGVNSVVLSLINTVNGGVNNVGNDLAIDDITFRPCGPLTTASFSSVFGQITNTVCTNTPVTVYGSVGGGLNTPTYQWQISSDNGATWTDIAGATTLNFTNPGFASGTYLFRLLSAEAGNIGSVNCRFISNTITLTVNNCGPVCSDTCYWKVTGNNIIGQNNIFGTLTNHDVRIKTSNTDRGIFTAGGNLGWNTMTPTAFLHVNCNGGNDGGTLSDVRFEGLESGTGTIMVIDKAGYVHNSRIGITTGISNNCTTTNIIPKVADATGNLTCSQLYDDGLSVGIGTTGPFNYTWAGGLTGPIFPPTSGTVRLDVAGVTRSLAYIATSDERFKEKINDIHDPMKIINNLSGKTYNWNEKAQKELGADSYKQYGFLAQDVKKVLPEAVVIDKKGYYGIYYNAFIPVLVEGQKELYKLYQEELNRNTLLEKKLEALTDKVNELSSKKTEVNKDAAKAAASNSLSQNVPNPFGNETDIEYHIAKMEKSAFLMITDLTGRELKRIPLATAGTGKITFRKADLAAGIYIYSLIIDNTLIDSKKMVLSY